MPHSALPSINSFNYHFPGIPENHIVFPHYPKWLPRQKLHSPGSSEPREEMVNAVKKIN